jgi:hypothetical protein
MLSPQFAGAFRSIIPPLKIEVRSLSASGCPREESKPWRVACNVLSGNTQYSSAIRNGEVYGEKRCGWVGNGGCLEDEDIGRWISVNFGAMYCVQHNLCNYLRSLCEERLALLLVAVRASQQRVRTSLQLNSLIPFIFNFANALDPRVACS